MMKDLNKDAYLIDEVNGGTAITDINLANRDQEIHFGMGEDIDNSEANNTIKHDDIKAGGMQSQGDSEYKGENDLMTID